MSDGDGRGQRIEEMGGQLRILGEKFLLRTREQSNQLRQLLTEVAAGHTGALAQLEEIAHKIHGSGSMFGFTAISDCGGALERLAESLAAPTAGSADATANPAALAQLTALLGQLEAAVEQALTR